jgi:hypothetical protein
MYTKEKKYYSCQVNSRFANSILDQVNYHHSLAMLKHMVKHNKVNKKKKTKKKKKEKQKKHSIEYVYVSVFLYRTEKICVAVTQTTIDFLGDGGV